jgi:hypothetical protein
VRGLALGTLAALLALAVAAGAGEEASPSPPAPPAPLAGELTRVDLVRRSVTIETDGRDAREVEAVVTKETRLLSGGRATRLEDLRPGDRVELMAVEEGARRTARVVKVVRTHS